MKCSSGCCPNRVQAELQLKKGLFLHKSKPNLPDWRKGKLKACFLYRRGPFPMENTCSASHSLELFQEVWVFGFAAFFHATYSHAKDFPSHPSLTAPWSLDVPNSPGLSLRLGTGEGQLCRQTEVTVLTLADKACLNLLFRSCMLGDLGRGIREVLLLSGVLVVCCLLTSLQSRWKALKMSL